MVNGYNLHKIKLPEDVLRRLISCSGQEKKLYDDDDIFLPVSGENDNGIQNIFKKIKLSYPVSIICYDMYVTQKKTI